MREGFVNIQRRLVSPETFEVKNLKRTMAWIDMISMADHRTGIVAHSLSFLAVRWKVSRSTVFLWISRWVHERSLERLAERSTEHDAEQYFVVNYAKYHTSTKHLTEQRTEHGAEHSTEPIEEDNSNKLIVPTGVNTTKGFNKHLSEEKSSDQTLLGEVVKNDEQADSDKTIFEQIIEQAFDAYVQIVGRTSISKPVREKFRARMGKLIKSYGANALMRAWRAMAENDFLMGDNPGGVKYLHNVEYAMRVQNIDKYLAQTADDAEMNQDVTPDPIVYKTKVTRPDGTVYYHEETSHAH